MQWNVFYEGIFLCYESFMWKINIDLLSKEPYLRENANARFVGGGFLFSQPPC